MSYIELESELRQIIGSPPNVVYMKKLEALEKHSQRYLELSCLLAITCQGFPGNILLVSTQDSRLTVVGNSKFSITVNTLADNEKEVIDQPCGLYVLVAGFEESLRINGAVTVIPENNGDSRIVVSIQEQYFHCAKSIRRSQFWTPVNSTSSTDAPLQKVQFFEDHVQHFIRESTFLLLATQNEHGDTDLSPRGDPAGFVRVIDETTVLIPERPGNKLADSLTNIITNPSLAVILFIPGTKHTLILSGCGKIMNSQDLLSGSAINNKTPKLGIEIDVAETYFGVNPALSNSDIWNVDNFIDRSLFPTFGKMMTEQVQLAGKMPGGNSVFGKMLGKAAGAVGNVMIRHDYKKNMY